jgi:hypothetical protein
MMESGTTKTAKLSAAEVEAMAKSGALRAGDILTKKEAASLGTMIAKIKLNQQVTKISPVQVAKISPVQVSKVSPAQVAKISPAQVSKASSLQVSKASSLQVSRASSLQVSKASSLQVSKAVGPNNPTIVSGVGKGKTGRRS